MGIFPARVFLDRILEVFISWGNADLVVASQNALDRAHQLMTLTLRQPPQFEALFWRFLGRIALSAVVTKTGACRIVDGG